MGAELAVDELTSLREALAALESTRGQWIHSVNAQACLAAIAKARDFTTNKPDNPLTNTE